MIEEEQAKLKEIVTKGMESYQTGNLEEAMAIADHAILTNPSYGEAYALKGLIHERRAEYAEALDSYETVVALNPDSAIDKIKLNQLRNAFALRQAGEPKTDRRSAAVMGLAATLLFASVGGIVYGLMNTSHESKQTQSNNLPILTKPQTQNVNNQTQAGNQPVQDPNKPNPGNHEAGYEGPLGGPDRNPEIDSAPHTANRTRSNRSSSFDGSEGIVDPFPVNNGRIGPSLPANQPDKGPGQKGKEPSDPPPQPQNGGGETGDGGTKVAEKTENPTYVISVSNKANDGSKGGENSTPSRGNTGRTYQQQAQSLQRSGKSSQARDTYQKAIDAYEKDLSSGKGDKEAAQAGINTCKQALKNLKD